MPRPYEREVRAAMARLLELGGVEAESRTAEVEGRRLHYLEAGSGPPVVLVQGAGGGAANWYRIIAPLAERHRVLAADLPGFGLSDPAPPVAPLGVSVARTIAAWLEAVGVDRCDLVGTSFGGLVALRLAQEAPMKVRRLVLLDSVGLGRSLPLVVRGAALPGLGRLALAPSRAGTACLFRWLLTADRRDLDARHRSALIEYLWRSAQAGDARTMVRAVSLFGGIRGQREVLSRNELARLEPPLLVVWGERDRLLPPAHGRLAASAARNAEFHALPGVGHSPNWEAPAAFLELLLPFLDAPEHVPVRA